MRLQNDSGGRRHKRQPFFVALTLPEPLFDIGQHLFGHLKLCGGIRFLSQAGMEIVNADARDALLAGKAQDFPLELRVDKLRQHRAGFDSVSDSDRVLQCAGRSDVNAMSCGRFEHGRRGNTAGKRKGDKRPHCQ